MHFVPTLYKNHSSYKICIIKQVVMKIFSVPLCFCLFYYIICDVKFVRSFDEDPKSSNQTSGDLKQSGDSEQRAKSSDPLKEREARENNSSNFTNKNDSSNQSQADPSHVTDDPNDKASAEQRAKSEEAVRQREQKEASGGQSQTDYSNQARQADPSHVTNTAATPKSQESNNLSNSQSPKLIDLDIKKTNSSTEFNCSEKGNVVTYTPKPGYGFGTVKKSKGSCNCTGSDKVVWEAENGSKHSNKVVVETDSDKKKTLTIHSVDGTTAVYKESKGGDFSVQNDDSTKDSKPGGSSAVTHSN